MSELLSPNEGDSSSEFTFSEFLEIFDIPINNWGKGGTKSINHLIQEFIDNESVIEIEPGPERNIIRKTGVAMVEVRYVNDGAEFRLKEQFQLFHGDGSLRERGTEFSIAEKRRVGESWTDVAIRGIKEELGIKESPDLQFLGQQEIRRESESYPGLTTESTYTYFVTYLTPEQFDPLGYVEQQPDKTTYFTWEKVPPETSDMLGRFEKRRRPA